jgi:molecular chaperone DnaK
MAMQRLKEGSEKAKHELSSAYETDITCRSSPPTPPVPSTEPDSHTGKLEELVDDLIQRMNEPAAKRCSTPICPRKISTGSSWSAA